MGTENCKDPGAGEGAVVAESHGSDTSAVRATRLGNSLGERLLSGADIVKALVRAGFDARLDGPDHVRIGRGRVLVLRVPLAEVVRHELLAAILRTAGVSPDQLAALLEE